jgi:hypothetical protein
MMQEEISKFVITELNKKKMQIIFSVSLTNRESNKNIQIKVIFLKFD